MLLYQATQTVKAVPHFKCPIPSLPWCFAWRFFQCKFWKKQTTLCTFHSLRHFHLNTSVILWTQMFLRCFSFLVDHYWRVVQELFSFMELIKTAPSHQSRQLHPRAGLLFTIGHFYEYPLLFYFYLQCRQTGWLSEICSLWVTGQWLFNKANRILCVSALHSYSTVLLISCLIPFFQYPSVVLRHHGGSEFPPGLLLLRCVDEHSR